MARVRGEIGGYSVRNRVRLPNSVDGSVSSGRGSRLRILEAATHLFYEKGFSATSVRDITLACNLTQAALYVHFDSKDALLREIVQRLHDLLDDCLSGVEADTSLDPEEKVVRLAEAFVVFVTEHQELTSVAGHDWRHLSEPSRSTISAIRVDVMKRFESIVRPVVQKRPAVRSAANESRVTTVAALDMMNGIAEWYTPQGRMSQQQLAAAYGHFVLGMAKGTGNARGPRSRIGTASTKKRN